MSLSGTLSPLHLFVRFYCYFYPHLLHNDRSMGRAELTMFVNIAKQCGDQLMACFVCGRFGLDRSKLDGGKPDRSKPDVEVILLRMSIPQVAEVFAAYTVMSSSECEGSCSEHDISVQS